VSPDEEKGVVVALHVWEKQRYDLKPDYELDWSTHFDHATRQVPSSSTWNNILLPQLRDLEKTIHRSTECRLIHLRGKLCLSAAFAFGHVFSVAAGYRLELQHRTQSWRSETPPDPACRLEVVEEPGSGQATDLLLVLSVTDNARPQVLEYVKDQGLMFRAHTYLSPVGGPSDFGIKGIAHASALAQQTRQELRRLLRVHHPKNTHLFYWGPQSLAVLIGQKLNACGAIQLYEYLNPGYAPSCLLR